MANSPPDNGQISQQRARYRQQSLRALATILLVGLVLAGIALFCATKNGIVAALGIGFLIAATAFACGALLGFLFGVPRVLARDNSSAPATPTAGDPSAASIAAAVPGAARQRLISSNTNLERISDWLSTMLIGISLTQLGNINSLFIAFAAMIASQARVFPDGAESLPLVCSILLVLGLVCGFLFMYLNTRLILTRLFADSEDDTFQPLSGSLASAIRSAQATLAPSDGVISQRLSKISTVTVSDGLTAMRDALYKVPEGYKTAISLAGKLSVTTAVNLADYWFYLACAFGQAHAAASDDAERESARDNALDAVQRALAIDPTYQAWFVRLLGDDPIDDDLETLANDGGLRRLLRLPPAPA